MVSIHLKDGINCLEKMDKIAVGTRNKVCKVTWKTIHIQTYALKIMNTKNKDTKELHHFLSEYEMLCIMSHLCNDTFGNWLT